jgi:hypothetical protein
VNARGYYRKDGTYVRPHVRTAPDGNPYNNYSFPGNYNPNTGRITGGNPATYLERYYTRSGAASGYSTMSPPYTSAGTTSALPTPTSSSSAGVASTPPQLAMLPPATAKPTVVPPTPEITTTYASLVQYDGPKIKSGITLDAQFLDDGSGSGETVVRDIRSYLLKGTFLTIKPGGRDWPKPKIFDRDTLNKLQILSDRPWVIATATNGETILECVYGSTRPTEQKKGACRDNFGNRYHVVLMQKFVSLDAPRSAISPPDSPMNIGYLLWEGLTLFFLTGVCAGKRAHTSGIRFVPEILIRFHGETYSTK